MDPIHVLDDLTSTLCGERPVMGFAAISADDVKRKRLCHVCRMADRNAPNRRDTRPPFFHMRTRRRNRQVANLVRRTTKACETQPRKRVLEILRQGIARIAVAAPEVRSAEAIDSIAASLALPFHRAGLVPLRSAEI